MTRDTSVTEVARARGAEEIQAALAAELATVQTVIDQVKGHFEARKALADKLQENASRVLALCSETIRKKATFQRDKITDALIAQSILEFQDRKKLVEQLRKSATASCDLAVSKLQSLAAVIGGKALESDDFRLLEQHEERHRRSSE